ncbi:hypothetical protein CTI12_AA617720 [Artemisia annua]|uniref:Uncharacterized protein n=1 Tax=Artemisia annua TaxID=35608 RepID=A0A2U1KCT2_ARTAN|nr:hypothetical protein CTI12_AA617720 [Artemisia annua]
MSLSEGSINNNQGNQNPESSKRLKRSFMDMMKKEGDDRIKFEYELRTFAESEVWDLIKEPLSPRLCEDEYSICCENTAHMVNALKESRIEFRVMLLSIHEGIMELLTTMSKMNRKLEDDKVKGKGKMVKEEFNLGINLGI